MEELTIGQRIAAKRKELGLSQIELGEKMGVSRQSVSKWEADAAIPEIDKLIALSKLYGVSVGWLLGVEGDAAPEDSPEQTFTDREWEIIDRLTQEKPQVPKWLMPLTAGAAAVSLCAALLSGAAFYANHSRKAELSAIRHSVENLAIDLGVELSEERLLANYQLVAQPSPGLEECTFLFTGIPAYFEPKDNAELVITLDGETVRRQKCQWDGGSYSAQFTLPAYNGYAVSFQLTDRDGTVRICRVYDFLLSELGDHCRPGEISVTWEKQSFLDGSLHFENLNFHIEAPGVYRDTPDLWAKCDLVVLGDGRELGRTDILNRSPYSKPVNFSTAEVDFFTREQSVAVGDLSGINKLELMLDCKLTTGLDIQKPLGSISAIKFR